MADLVEIKKKILDLVDEYEHTRSDNRSFVPGETPVRYAGRVFGSRELRNATEAVLDFWLTAGRFTDEFEQRLSEYVQGRDVLLVNSGSSANLLAVSALTSRKLSDRRLKPGDEVITVAAGFPTTVGPIVQNGLVPVFVDVDIGGYNALPEQVAQAVGPKTRALVLAHALGNPWDVDAIRSIAQQHDLWVIEDNCDALGSTYAGERTGTFGDLGSFSFYPAHHITTGEGGAVVCSTEELAKIVRSLRDWGRDCFCSAGENNTCGRRFSQQFGTLPAGYDHKYVYSHVGYNLKATDIQAAIGCAQLDKLDGFIQARRHNHAFLLNELEPFRDHLILPRKTPQSDPSWFAFVITVSPEAGFARHDLVRFLEEHRVETRNLFSGNLLRHPGFQDIHYRVAAELKNTDLITTNAFFIGVYPGIHDRELEYMVEVFRRFFKTRT